MKFLCRLLLIYLLGLGSAYAQSNLPTCQGTNDRFGFKWNNCFGSSSKDLNSIARYDGEYQNGRPHGHGTATFDNGEKYVGEFKNRAYDGLGTLYSSNGLVVYQGIWSKNSFIRSAPVQQLSEPNQAVSVPSVESNIAQSNLPACPTSGYFHNCFAAYSLDNGEKYVGEFKDNKFNGQGTFTYFNGARYVGEWKDSSFNGQGTYIYANGLVDRQGLWEKGKFIGSIPVQLATAPSQENERLLAEVEEAKRKQAELEQKLRIAQQQASQTTQNPAVNTQSAIPTGKRVALVIGNAAYKVNPLKNPVNDSTDMARSLRSVGFDVIEANNTTLAQMREVTRRFADKLGNSDVGLVYYSGHGVEVKGKNYLIPVNADIKREYEVIDQAFDASQFLEMMDNIRGPNNKRVNILIVDACRNNELQKSWRSTNNGLARMDAPGGTFISFATAPGRVAADGVGRNSPYTKHLLQALKQPNVPIEQVFKVVRRNVMEETRGEQIPWENSSLVGDFYFTVQR